MHAVVNRIRLREPLDDAAWAQAQRDLDAQAATVEGLVSLQLLQSDEGELVVLVFGEDAEALERTREQLGNEFMRTHVIPHADGPPQRITARVVATYRRGSAD